MGVSCGGESRDRKEKTNEKNNSNLKSTKNKTYKNAKKSSFKNVNNLPKEIKKDGIKIEDVIKNDKKSFIVRVNSKKEIIRECYIKDSNPNLPDLIIDILRKSVVRIERSEEKISTGFFMKIDLNKKQHDFLLTCNHSIDQEDINSKLKINIFYGKSNNEKQLNIELDKNKRFIKTYEELDVTIIEILSEDNIESKRFLYPDLNYKNEQKYNQYLNNEVYLAGFPSVQVNKGQRHISSGLIKKIEESENSFEHSCNTKNGSSGSPIINYNKLVIGIHSGEIKGKQINYGYFIGAIIDKLNLEKEIKDINLNNLNINPLNISNDFLKNRNIKNPNLNSEKELFDSIEPFYNNPLFVNIMKNIYNDPQIIESLNKFPLIKDSGYMLKVGQNPEQFFKAIKNKDENEIAKFLEKKPNENPEEEDNKI